MLLLFEIIVRHLYSSFSGSFSVCSSLRLQDLGISSLALSYCKAGRVPETTLGLLAVFFEMGWRIKAVAYRSGPKWERSVHEVGLQRVLEIEWKRALKFSERRMRRVAI